MSIALTGRAYAEIGRLRRAHAPGRVLGPRWTILGSDVLFAALDLADVHPGELLDRMSRTGDTAELGRGSPLFSHLLPQLPSCTLIRVRLNIVEIRCGSNLIYVEERHRPMLIVHGVSLPEQVTPSVRGLRLSKVCDVASMPALASVDLIVTRADNLMHVPTRRDARVEFELAVGWSPLAPAPSDKRDGFRADVLVERGGAVPRVPRREAPGARQTFKHRRSNVAP